MIDSTCNGGTKFKNSGWPVLRNELNATLCKHGSDVSTVRLFFFFFPLGSKTRLFAMEEVGFALHPVKHGSDVTVSSRASHEDD